MKTLAEIKERVRKGVGYANRSDLLEICDQLLNHEIRLTNLEREVRIILKSMVLT